MDLSPGEVGGEKQGISGCGAAAGGGGTHAGGLGEAAEGPLADVRGGVGGAYVGVLDEGLADDADGEAAGRADVARGVLGAPGGVEARDGDYGRGARDLRGRRQRARVRGCESNWEQRTMLNQLARR